MNRRDILVAQYKEMKTEAGVYAIRNQANHKVWISSTRNLKSINGKKLQLEVGSHMNKKLQAEWSQYGAQQFDFEILEVLDKKDLHPMQEKDALAKLEQKWLDQLQPYDDKGYHDKP